MNVKLTVVLNYVSIIILIIDDTENEETGSRDGNGTSNSGCRLIRHDLWHHLRYNSLEKEYPSLDPGVLIYMGTDNKNNEIDRVKPRNT